MVPVRIPTAIATTAASTIRASTTSIDRIVVVRIWIVVWAVPAAIPACVVAIVPAPVPAAIVESEAWRYVPPWIIVAVIPEERIVIGNVVPRAIAVIAEVWVVETTDAVAVGILLHHEDRVVDRGDVLGVVLLTHHLERVGEAGQLERIAQGSHLTHATVTVGNLVVESCIGQVVLYHLVQFGSSAVVTIQIPIIIGIGRPGFVLSLLVDGFLGRFLEVNVIVLSKGRSCCWQSNHQGHGSHNHSLHHSVIVLKGSSI